MLLNARFRHPLLLISQGVEGRDEILTPILKRTRELFPIPDNGKEVNETIKQHE
jgi:hypothetical protein